MSFEGQARAAALFLVRNPPSANRKLSPDDIAFLKAAEVATKGKKYGDVVVLYASRLGRTLSAVKDNEAETLCHLFLALLGGIEAGSLGRVAPAVIEGISTGLTGERLALKVHLLGVVHNSLVALGLREPVALAALLRQALEADAADLVQGVCGAALLTALKADDAETRRDLGALVCRALEACDRREEAHDALAQLVASYKADALPQAVAEDAERYVRGVLDRPGLVTGEMLALPAVAALKPARPALYDLMRVLVEGDAAAFAAFAEAHADLASPPIRRKMRSALISSLAQSSRNLAFSEIAAGLAIPESDVEAAVVDALTDDVIDASINQIDATVRIRRFMPRSFATPEWTLLAEKISSAKNLVDTVSKATLF